MMPPKFAPAAALTGDTGKVGITARLAVRIT